jgi:hypothetical protein
VFDFLNLFLFFRFITFYSGIIIVEFHLKNYVVISENKIYSNAFAD